MVTFLIRRAGARYEADKYGVCDRVFLWEDCNWVNACQMMHPSGPGLAQRQILNSELKVTVFPSIDTKLAILSSIFASKETADEIIKERVRFFCRSYRIFGLDSFLSISTYPRNFVTKGIFKPRPWQKLCEFCFGKLINLAFFLSFLRVNFWDTTQKEHALWRGSNHKSPEGCKRDSCKWKSQAIGRVQKCPTSSGEPGRWYT